MRIMKTQLFAISDVLRRDSASSMTVDERSFRHGAANKPTITIQPGTLHKVPEQIAAALSHPQAQYFRRDRILVKASRVLEQTDKAGVARATGAVAFIRADPDMLTYAEFERWLIAYDRETNTRPTEESVTSTTGE